MFFMLEQTTMTLPPRFVFCLTFLLALGTAQPIAAAPGGASDAGPMLHTERFASKPSPDEAIAALKSGNARFLAGTPQHPHTDNARLIQAGSENQGDHAFATVITCSDSRIPLERIFDAGVMDLFVIRVAGNVCDVDEIGSIEYGLAHVNTPVMVVLGHTQCGAVTAVTHAVQGNGSPLERNIPQLVDNIQPAVKRAIHNHPHAEGQALIDAGIEENVWQSIEDLYRESPATRRLVQAGHVKVVGAIYDVATGSVKWLDEAKSDQILAQFVPAPNTPVVTSTIAAATNHGDHDTAASPSDHQAHANDGHAAQAVQVHAAPEPAAAPVITAAKTGHDTHAPHPVYKKLDAIKDGQAIVHLVDEKAYAESERQAEDYWKQEAHSTQAIEHHQSKLFVFLIIGFGVFSLTGLVVLNVTGKINQFNIGTKLYTSHGLLIALSGMLAGVAWYYGNQVKTASSYEHEATDMMFLASELGRSESDFMLFGIANKERGEQSIQKHEKDFESFMHHLVEGRGYEKSPETLALFDEIEKTAQHYAHEFETIAHKFHEIEEIKEQTDHLDLEIEHALEEVLHHHKEALHALEAKPNPAIQAIALAADLVSLLEETEIHWLKVFSNQNAYMLDHKHERIARMQEELGALQTSLAMLDVMLPAVEADAAVLGDELKKISLVKKDVNLYIGLASTLIKDQAAVNLASAKSHADIKQIEHQAAALDVYVREQTEATNHTAHLAEIAAVVSTLVLGLALSMSIVWSTVRPMHKIVDAVTQIADGDGDLTLRMPDDRKDELGCLGKSINRFIIKTHDVVAAVVGMTHEVASAATEIAASSEQIATGIEQQGTQVTQISAAVTEMSASATEVAQQSGDASGSANESGQAAAAGSDIVQETIQGMAGLREAVTASSESVQELGKRGEQIGEIIGVINEIADQTNLLALNAAIESARAGEHGRGFAVVADEVRKLADRTTQATEQIAQSIEAIQQETNLAVDRMNLGTQQAENSVTKATSAGESLNQIVASAQQVAGMIQSIASAANEQSAASEQISRNVEEISQVTQQTSDGTRMAAQASRDLSMKAEQLQNVVGRFKLDTSAIGA